MVSSDVKDLSNECAVVCKGIRQLRFERFRLETIDSISDLPEDVCDELAAGCDLFILLIGKRYGRVISESGVSAVEKMFHIVRHDNPNKILIYIQTLSDGEREREAEDFIHRITEDSKAYFQIKSFRSPDELVGLVENDINTWLAARIAQAPLEPINILSLPLPREILTAAGFLLASLLCLSAAVEAFQRFYDVPPSYLPSIVGFFSTTAKYFSSIYRAVLLSCGVAFISYLLSIFISSAVLLAFFKLFPRRHLFLARFFAVVMIVISALLLLFGSTLFYIPAKSVVMVSITGAAILLFCSQNADQKLSEKEGSANDRFFILKSIGNMYISPLTANLFAVVFGLVLLGEILHVSSYSGVGLMYLYTKGSFDANLSVCVIINALLVVVFASYFVRIVQSYLGWKLIVRPALFDRMQQPESRAAGGFMK